MGLLQDQEYISAQQPMPVDDMSTSSSVQTVSGETVALYYSNGGTRTVDAGQAAGTAVAGQLANKNILDSSGSAIATFKDKSLSFTGNCFTTEVKFPMVAYKSFKDATWASKLSSVTSQLANGEYCVDYTSGTIYGKKATTTSSLTSTTYLVNQAQMGSAAPTPSTTNSWSVAKSDGVLEASRVVKASAGKLSKAIIQLDTTATTGTYYIQFLNASSLPADGAVTHLVDPIVAVHTSGTTDLFSFDFTGPDLAKSGVNASTGIVVVLSTTRATKTIASAYLTMTVFYE